MGFNKTSRCGTGLGMGAWREKGGGEDDGKDEEGGWKLLKMGANLAVSVSQTYKNWSSQFRICLIEGYMAVLLILNQGLSKPLINKYIDLFFRPLDSKKQEKGS